MEQDTVRIMKRTVGLILLTGIAFCTGAALMWFFGSPWDRSGADQTVADYLSKQYPKTQLTATRAQFDASSRSYQVQVQNPDAADGDFTVFAGQGQILWDSYEQDVLQKGNVVRRLEESYTLRVQKLLEKAELSEKIEVAAQLDLDQVSLLHEQKANLSEDALTYNLMLSGETEDPSIDRAADLLTQVYKVLENDGCAFSHYGIQLYNSDQMIAAAQISASQIQSGNLAAHLQLALQGEPAGDLYVSMRGPEETASSRTSENP